VSKIPNFQERMAKVVQVLSNLNENFFDFFDFAVKKFRGSSLAQSSGVCCSLKVLVSGLIPL
jgi:hypothetical protein